MKKLIMLMLVMVASTAGADELMQMSNGMTCWRNNVGVVYGCNGGVKTDGTGFNDVKTGTRYESTGDGRAVNTRTGGTIGMPIENAEDKIK
jgi:hypothetical protein